MPGETVYCPSFATLMDLADLGGQTFRSINNDRNDNGRVYGGQLLAQALGAAQRTVAGDRCATVLQLVFLSGARPETPIDYTVTALQDGRRFSSRQVTARQGSTTIISAHVSFQAPRAGTNTHGHQRQHGADWGRPETSRAISEAGPGIRERLGLGGYASLQSHPYIECRFVDPTVDALPAGPGQPMRFWMRIAQPLPKMPGADACAVAYLSDWWLNYTSIAPYLGLSTYDGFYVASLNHSLWFHAPCRADEWMYCVTDSPWADSMRGLSFGRLYGRDGTLVATMAQESLQTLATSG
jgi:acyl-CoA thioesterase-2